MQLFSITVVILCIVFINSSGVNSNKTEQNLHCNGCNGKIAIPIKDSHLNLTEKVDFLTSRVSWLMKREIKRKKEYSRIKSRIYQLEKLILKVESNKAIGSSCRKLIESYKRDVEARPRIIQLTPWTVRISWKKLSSIDKCTEYFFLRFWKLREPTDIRFSKKMTIHDEHYVDLKVDPEILYNFQKITAYHVKDRIVPYDSETKRKEKKDLIVKHSDTVAYRTLMTQPQGIVREVTVTRNRNETYGFILRFDQNEGLVEISGIDSGSPAGKIGKICIGDKIWAINHKRMQGKTLSILKKVRKWVKHFASSITFHLITNQYNGCKDRNIARVSKDVQITPQISESTTLSTVTASITASPITTQKTQKRAAIQRKRNTSIPEDQENSLQLPSTPLSVSLCKIGMSIVGGDGDSSLAYGGWYKQNLFGDYRIHSYDVRGNRVLINNQRFFLSKNINDIWMVSETIQSSTAHGKGGIRNVNCRNVSSPELCGVPNQWEYFDENQNWKIDKKIAVQCVL